MHMHKPKNDDYMHHQRLIESCHKSTRRVSPVMNHADAVAITITHIRYHSNPVPVTRPFMLHRNVGTMMHDYG